MQETKQKVTLTAASIWRVLSAFAFSFILFSCTGKQADQQQSTATLKALSENRPTEIKNSVPEKVYEVLEYIRKNNKAPEGYVGGRKFGNFEKRLPINNAKGKKLQYQEWDVNPKVEGRSRGKERLVTSNDHTAWYTKDHYESFIEVE